MRLGIIVGLLIYSAYMADTAQATADLEATFVIKTSCSNGLCNHLILDVNEKDRKVFILKDPKTRLGRIKQIKEIMSQYAGE